MFFNMYFGVPELRMMKMLGFDAMTLGNHEFDLTPQTLGIRDAGPQIYRLDASSLAAGLYHYELRTGTQVAHGTITVLR